MPTLLSEDLIQTLVAVGMGLGAIFGGIQLYRRGQGREAPTPDASSDLRKVLGTIAAENRVGHKTTHEKLESLDDIETRLERIERDAAVLLDRHKRD